jgi:hypothetical protein
MKGYKGFNKDLTCNGKQYVIGDTATEKTAKLCEKGIHFCEAPLDVLNYYAPATSRYCEVKAEGVTDETRDDSKRVCTSLTVNAEIGVIGLAKAHIEYVKAHTTSEHTDPKQATAGYRGAATAGDSGAATAGDRGAATAGDSGAATADYRGAATAGSYGAATAGSYGAATAGDRGAATAGYRGAATAGDSGAATSRGSVSVGNNGVGLVRGNAIKAKGGLGAVLVIAVENDNNFDLKEWKAFVVDGETVKADTWYTLRNGKLVEDE